MLYEVITHPDAKPVFDLDSVSLLQAIKGLEAGHDLAGKDLIGTPSFFAGARITSYNVCYPKLLRGQARCGDGWRMLMNCLAAGRSISLPASSTAALKMCARTTGTYAALRRQFNLPLHRNNFV